MAQDLLLTTFTDREFGMTPFVEFYKTWLLTCLKVIYQTQSNAQTLFSRTLSSSKLRTSASCFLMTDSRCLSYHKHSCQLLLNISSSCHIHLPGYMKE